MVDTILLTGVYLKKYTRTRDNYLKYKGKEMDPAKIYIRKGYDSPEALGLFPINLDNDIAPSFADIDSCTGITVMSILDRNGFTFGWGNIALLATEEGKKEIASLLKTDSPTVSLSTTFVINEQEVNEIIEFIRENAPDKKIILGGPLLELNPHLTAKADYAVIGEGEDTYPVLLRAVLEGKPVDGIKGIAYRKEDNSVVVTEPAPYVDLNSCPAPNWNLARYNNGGRISYEASRSCPFKCTFCTYHLRGKFRYKSARKIFEDWKYYVENDVKHIYIFDSVFSSPKERLKELCELIIQEKLPITWECWVRASDCQDKEITDLMAKAGCKMVAFGLESASDQILKNMNKQVTSAQIEKAVNNIVSSRIMLFTHVIVGFPGETEETVSATTDFLVKSSIPVYNTKTFQIREKKMPILSDEERKKHGIKIGSECESIPDTYKGDQGPYWTTNTMTLTEAVSLNRRMVREVALKGRSICANLIDSRRLSELSPSLDRAYLYKSVKAYEKVAVLCLDESADEAEREKAWEELLAHYAVLTD